MYATLALENASSSAHNLLRREEEEEELKDHAGLLCRIRLTKSLRIWQSLCESLTYEIFTLGSEEGWRMVEDEAKYHLQTEGICINGIIYWILYSGVLVEGDIV